MEAYGARAMDVNYVPIVTRRALNWFIGLAVIAAVLSVGAVALGVMAYTTRTYDSLTVGHLTVRPPTGRREGVLVEFTGAETAYPAAAAGVRVAMPDAGAAGSTSQAAVRVSGGQVGLHAEEQRAAAVLADHPATDAFAVAGGAAGHLLTHNGASVE